MGKMANAIYRISGMYSRTFTESYQIASSYFDIHTMLTARNGGFSCG